MVFGVDARYLGTMRMTRTRMFLVAASLLLVPCGLVRAVTLPDTSFVDLDNDGVRGPNDLPLSAFTGPGQTGFNQFTAGPGYKPNGRPVGIVLEGNVVLGNETGDLQLFFVTGNVTVRGNVTVKSSDTLIWFTTIGGRISFAPGIVVKGNGQMMFQAQSGGTIDIGDHDVFSTRGYDGSDITFAADRALTVGTTTSFTTSAGYSNVEFQSLGTVAIGSGLRMRGPNHGGISIMAHANVDLTGLDIKTGYIHVEAVADTAHPAAKQVEIADSKLYQTYKNGEFRIFADPDWNTHKFAPHAIVLDHVLISTRTPWPIYYPDPPEIR